MFNTVQELAADIARELRERPESWTRYAAARTAEGAGCPVEASDAACWCLFGHILKRGVEPYTEEIAKPFFDAAGLDFEQEGYATINDLRTLEQIIDLCDKVATVNS